MGYIKEIANVMNRFTPEGKQALLSILKDNKFILNKNYGFTELPSLLSKNGSYQKLESELLNKNETIIDVMSSVLHKQIKISPDKLAAEKTALNCSFVLGYNFKKNEPLIKILTENFSWKKNELLKLTQKYCSGKLEKSILEAKTPDELSKLIPKILESNHKKELSICKKCLKDVPEHQFKKDLQARQIYLAAKQRDADFELQLQKILLSDVKKSEKILELEKRIKSFGVEYVHINDEANGQKILEALNIAKKNNIPIPQNIIFSPCSSCETDIGVNLCHSDLSKTIILNSNNNLENFIINSKGNVDPVIKDSLLSNYYIEKLNQTTTQHPLHSILHEMIHSESNCLVGKYKVDKSFKPVIDELPSYAKYSAKEGNFEETRTELRVKQVLETLNIGEGNLLNCLS